MYRCDKRLVDRLTNWETVFPEDEDKPEGNLYLEAAERVVELSNELEALRVAEQSKGYTLDYDADGLWLLQDQHIVISHIPQAMFDARVRQVIRQTKSLDQLAKADQEDGFL